MYAYFVRGAKHAAMCRTSIESVKRADPKAHFVVMTDESSRAWEIPEASVHLFEAGMPIMLANLEAQCLALSIAAYHESVTFLDADILMLEPLPPIENAHMTITWRDHALVDDDGEKVEAVAAAMPYNYGVIRANACYRSQEAFIWLRERIRRMHEGHQQWYGNQLALFELAGPRPSGLGVDEVRMDYRRIPWTLTQHGNPIRIAKLAGERWNYTPAMVGERLHGARSILHFKGRSRGLMESYAKRLELKWHSESQQKAA